MGQASATTTLSENRNDVQNEVSAPRQPRVDRKRFPPQLALVYQEAVASRDPRVTRVGLQILWRNLRDVMEAGAE
jgi:hypothetical protein